MWKNYLLLTILFLEGCNSSTLKEGYQLSIYNHQRIHDFNKNNERINRNEFEADHQFFIIKADSAKKDFILGDNTIESAFWIDKFMIFTVLFKDKTDGLHLVIKDEYGNDLYISKGQADSWRFDVKLYKTKQCESPVLVLGEIGDEQSWGVNAYLIANKLVEEIGFLDVYALNEYGESESIITFIEAYLEKDTIKFLFDKEVKIYQESSKKSFQGDDIQYIYANNELLRVQNK